MLALRGISIQPRWPLRFEGGSPSFSLGTPPCPCSLSCLEVALWKRPASPWAEGARVRIFQTFSCTLLAQLVCTTFAVSSGADKE